MNRLVRAGLVALAAASLLIGAGVVAPAYAANDYPTWAEVEAAKHDEKAKKAQIAKIQEIIDGLAATDAGLAKSAQEQNENYNIAQDALDAAAAKAKVLQAQADAADAAAAASAQQAGALVAQLARTGGQDITLALLMDSAHAQDLLYSIGMMNKVTDAATQIYNQAQINKNIAAALSAQAAVATDARKKLAKTAKSALDAAQTASDAAAQSLTAQQAKAKQLYAQLASLKGTTTEIEKQYEAGVAWEKAQEAVKNAPVAPPINPTPPAPSANAVGGAIAFAEAQLGEPYVLGGAGPDTWDCSGLTKMSYASVGVYIGTHSATNQYATMAAAQRLLPLSELVAGDLLFYSDGGSTTGTKYHTTMYIGNGQMIEAPYPGSVVRIKPIRYGDLVPYAGRPTP